MKKLIFATFIFINPAYADDWSIKYKRADLEKMIAEQAENSELPINLFKAIISVKNPYWNPKYNDGMGGRGLMLINSKLYAQHGKNESDLDNPRINLKVAAETLEKGKRLYGKDPVAVIKYYQCGKNPCNENSQSIVDDIIEKFEKLN